MAGEFAFMRIENLTKKYGENTVYENFSLDINEGEITCILGESGSGKTTLLSCIAGITDFVGEISGVKCSYVFQTPRLVPNLTVYNNLKLVCSDDNNIEEILDGLFIKNKRNSYPISLSGGQAQRVSLARAMLADSDIILMDEPFSSLDMKLKRDISLLYKDWQKSSAKTTLIVTHDVDEAIFFADRIIVLKDGKIAFDAVKEKISRDGIVSLLLDT